MYICDRCGLVFEVPKSCKSAEPDIDGTVYYETWKGCPECESSISPATTCELCGKWTCYEQDDESSKWCDCCKERVSSKFKNLLEEFTAKEKKCLFTIMEDYELCE